ATLARTSGVVRIAEDEGRGRVVTIVADDGTEDTYTIPSLARLEVVDGQEISAGDPIVEGPRDPKELLEIKGVRETQQYLVEEVQKVYRDQGVSIHDKHIELIVRQMTRRVVVQEPGDSRFLPGEAVDAKVYTDENKRLVQEAKVPAEGRPVVMGITKASLATDSWLSAASFQETTRVLTEAAIESRSDDLNGLKENIIIGKLIPAGTGMKIYNEIETAAPDYRPMEYWSSDRGDESIAEWLSGTYEAGGAQPPGEGGLAEVVDLPATDKDAPEAGSGSCPGRHDRTRPPVGRCGAPPARPGRGSAAAAPAGGDAHALVGHGEEQRGGVVDELVALDRDAAVKPGDHQLGHAADEDGGADAADLPARGRRPVALDRVLLDRGDELVAGGDAAPVEGLAAQGLDVQDPGPAAVLVDEGDDVVDRRPGLRPRVVGRGGVGLPDPVGELADEAVVDGHRQRLEVLEALVEVAGVELRRLAHGADRGPGPADRAEQVEGGVEQQRAPLGAAPVVRDAGPPGGAAAIGRSCWQRPLP